MLGAKQKCLPRPSHPITTASEYERLSTQHTGVLLPSAPPPHALMNTYTHTVMTLLIVAPAIKQV